MTEWGVFLKGKRVREIVGTELHCRTAARVLANYEGQFEAKPIAPCAVCEGRGFHEDEAIGMSGECPDCDGGYVVVT